MNEEKRHINGYEIIQSVKIDGMEIIVGEKPDAKKPYMMWRRSLEEPFGTESHLIPVFDSDYLKILREFIHCQSVYADNIGLDRIYRGSPYVDAALTAEACVEGGMVGDLTGRIVAIKADMLSPERRARSRQLMLVVSGPGCLPDERGHEVLGVNIYSGVQERWKRSDILGVIDENTLSGWAREKAAALRKPAIYESVLAKIRKGRQNAAQDKPKPKKRDKGGPEL